MCSVKLMLTFLFMREQHNRINKNGIVSHVLECCNTAIRWGLQTQDLMKVIEYLCKAVSRRISLQETDQRKIQLGLLFRNPTAVYKQPFSLSTFQWNCSEITLSLQYHHPINAIDDYRVDNLNKQHNLYKSQGYTTTWNIINLKILLKNWKNGSQDFG